MNGRLLTGELHCGSSERAATAFEAMSKSAERDVKFLPT
jgi:hypothetical protein